MTDLPGDGDDELAKRFRAVFNKEPVSAPSAKPVQSRFEGNYDVDEEEVGLLWTLLILSLQS
jgi:hypothetical protein